MLNTSTYIIGVGAGVGAAGARPPIILKWLVPPECPQFNPVNTRVCTPPPPNMENVPTPVILLLYSVQLLEIYRKCNESIADESHRCSRVDIIIFKSYHPTHAYQSLACETAINTEFSKIFSLKRIYVKYKNAIVSHLDCFFHTWKD